MIFIVRSDNGMVPTLDIRMRRQTPEIVPGGAGKMDYFCLGDPEVARSDGWTVVPVHDGWYADGQGGGVAIWGQGIYWEVRDTPFTVKEAAGPADTPAAAADEAAVDVQAGDLWGVRDVDVS